MSTQGVVTPQAPDPTLAPGAAPTSARLDQLGTATAGEHGTASFTLGTSVGTVGGVTNGGDHANTGDPVTAHIDSPADVDSIVYAAVRTAHQTKARGVASTLNGTYVNVTGQPSAATGGGATPNNKWAPSYGGTHGYSNSGVAS